MAKKEGQVTYSVANRLAHASLGGMPEATRRVFRVGTPILLGGIAYILPSGDWKGIAAGAGGTTGVYAARKAWQRHIVNRDERRLHRKDRNAWMGAWLQQYLNDHDGQEPPQALLDQVKDRGRILESDAALRKRLAEEAAKQKTVNIKK